MGLCQLTAYTKSHIWTKQTERKNETKKGATKNIYIESLWFLMGFAINCLFLTSTIIFKWPLYTTHERASEGDGEGDDRNI